MQGQYREDVNDSTFGMLQCIFIDNPSVMYRKFKEKKDKEYEAIVRRQVNESKTVAENEGISIPKTLDDYVAPSRLDVNGKNGLSGFSSHDDDDLGIDVRIE